MEYYKLLQLDREPFSNSPDPEYFFNSRQHMGCLQKLELALRLKRGLNVVIGDVGTGKTTLCRQLIRNFSTDPDIETHLILDPATDSSIEFLKTIQKMLCSTDNSVAQSPTEMKEVIKRSLFQTGVSEKKTIVLIIDEGQKISEPCLEILRELLNYETNTYKLLQIVIFAQLEFRATLQRHANFADRINLLHHLHPLRFADTKQLIQHRLRLSSTAAKPISLFTLPALWAIHRASRGYPRKIINLCHQSILALIIQNQTKAGWALIQSCKNRLKVSVSRKRNIILISSLIGLTTLLIILFFPIVKSMDKPINGHRSFKIENPHISLPKISRHEIIVAPPTPPGLAAEKNSLSTNETKTVAQIDTLADNHDQIDTEMASGAKGSDPGEAQLIPSLHTSPPEQLGQMLVRPNDTLSVMVLRVYGTLHSQLLRSVVAANGHIQDPNNIGIGNTITFPSIPQQPMLPDAPFFMVVLDEYQTLPSAMQHLQKFSLALSTKPTMVASWSPAQGLRFQIIQKKYFSSKVAARNHVDMIPYAIAAQSEILSGWPEDTIFYSDPFKDNVHLSTKNEG